MPKRVDLPYRVGNKLAAYIESEREKRREFGKKNVLISEIETELANFCFLGVEGIKAIKQRNTNPSIAVGFRIAEYFNEDPRAIFPLIMDSEEKPEKKTKPRLGVKKRTITKNEKKEES